VPRKARFGVHEIHSSLFVTLPLISIVWSVPAKTQQTRYWRSKEGPGGKQNDQQQNQKGTELRDHCTISEEGSPKEHQKTELDHVPVVPALVLHDVQGPGNVTVTVVATKVVHALSVDPVGLSYGLVPLVGPTGKIADVHLQVPGRSSKGHSRQRPGVVACDKVRALEIVGVAPAVGDSHVTDKRQYGRERVEGRPQYREGDVLALWRWLPDFGARRRVVVVTAFRHCFQGCWVGVGGVKIFIVVGLCEVVMIVVLVLSHGHNWFYLSPTG